MKQTQFCVKYAKLKPYVRQKSTLMALICGVLIMVFAANALAQNAGELDDSFAPPLANYETGRRATDQFRTRSSFFLIP